MCDASEGGLSRVRGPCEGGRVVGHRGAGARAGGPPRAARGPRGARGLCCI